MKNTNKSRLSKVKSWVLIFGVALLIGLNLSGVSIFSSQFERLTDKSVEASKFNENAEKTVSAEMDYETKLIPLGTAFGIKLYTDGVIVASLADIKTNEGVFCPAKDAGIQVGDYILEADGVTLNSNVLLGKIIGSSKTGKISLKVRRGNEIFTTVLTPVVDGQYLRGGMWVRDSAAGIGTLTYYDPKTGKFAGLGHGICDIDTKTIMNVRDGEPAEIAITSVTKGEKNNPGKINGYFDEGGSFGTLTGNNETGIFGTLDSPPTGEEILVGKRENVVEGPAEIIATIDENGPKKYSVKIEKISNNREQTTKNMVISITDEELLKKTGGIVQGMSGFPILQDSKIIGAVTHVFIDNPKMGYAIFIENMLNSEN